jgi:hypothetical protein
METIGECVGGCCDGVQFDCPDKNEPDDMPDSTTIRHDQSGARGQYFIDPKQLKSGRPTIRGQFRVWFYIHESLLE